jgi:hypothetical protein
MKVVEIAMVQMLGCGGWNNLQQITFNNLAIMKNKFQID